MQLPSDLIKRLCALLGYHEVSCIIGVQCTKCVNFKHLKVLDKDINDNLIKNYCKSDKTLVNQVCLKMISNKAQRIHVLGNHWPLINSLNHRKFYYLSKQIDHFQQVADKKSICITDTVTWVTKMDHKLVVTQGYSKDYNLDSVDYLVVEKKYIDDSFEVPFDVGIIPENGFLVIDLNSGENFYTEG